MNIILSKIFAYRKPSLEQMINYFDVVIIKRTPHEKLIFSIAFQ